MNNSRNASGGGLGIYTAAIVMGGDNPAQAYTEQYNGSSWTEVNDLNTARKAPTGSGTTTAGLAYSGVINPSTVKNETETWNGSSWTEVNNLNTARGLGASSTQGTSTASLMISGQTTPTNMVANTESWDGTNWTEVNDVNTARRSGGGAGTQTAALYSGGGPGSSTATEIWDGTSWTETADLNTGRNEGTGSGESSSVALYFGGSPDIANTESWDGTSWTEVSDLSTGRNFLTGIGTGANSIAAGAESPSPARNVTEEWSAPSDFVQIHEGQLYYNSTTNTFKETITDLPGASWASGVSINDGRNAVGSAGTTTAALLFTGDPVSGTPSGVSANTEKYDGSSWTEVNNTNTARRECFYGCGLTNTAALCAGGYDGSAKTGNVETWDGTNWTEVANLNQTRNGGALVGSSTAAIGFGGIEPPFTGKTEFWNGSTWTELNDLNTSRYTISGAGPSYTAALAFGGYGTTYDAETEEWNGTSWTEVSDLNTARYGIGATVSASSLNSLLAFGGDEAPPANNKTEFWNGSSWSELAELSSNRFQMGGAGTSGTGALSFGGAPNPVATSTEEWTVNLANKTITAS
jgi:hypothetical protein